MSLLLGLCLLRDRLPCALRLLRLGGGLGLRRRLRGRLPCALRLLGLGGGLGLRRRLRGLRLVGGLGLLRLVGLRLLARGVDLVDPYAGHVLAVAALPAVGRLLLELEDDQLRAQRLAEDGAAHAGALHGRGADRHGIAVADEEDAVEGDRGSGIAAARRMLDDQLAAGLDAVLLSTAADDGVHHCSPGSDLGPGARRSAHTETGRVLSPRDDEVYRAIGGVSTKRRRVRIALRTFSGRSSAATTSSGRPAPLASSWSTVRRVAVCALSSTSTISTSSMSGRRSRSPASLRRSLSPRRRLPESSVAPSSRTTAPRSASEVRSSSPATWTSYSAPRSCDAADGKPCQTSLASRSSIPSGNRSAAAWIRSSGTSSSKYASTTSPRSSMPIGRFAASLMRGRGLMALVYERGRLAFRQARSSSSTRTAWRMRSAGAARLKRSCQRWRGPASVDRLLIRDSSYRRSGPAARGAGYDALDA